MPGKDKVPISDVIRSGTRSALVTRNPSLSLSEVSFNCNRQIHIHVNSTIDMKCSCRCEWSNVMRIVAAKVHADSGSSWLLERFLISAGIPHTIFDDVHNCDVVNQG